MNVEDLTVNQHAAGQSFWDQKSLLNRPVINVMVLIKNLLTGGFIHGFRYTTRMVHRILEQRNHGIAWPHQTYPITEIVPTMIKRINEASGAFRGTRFVSVIFA